jgi:CCR4-NOT transcriptional complex subunit CAF120
MFSENRPESPSMSVLTSPHSIRGDAPDPQADHASILTSPHSPRLANAELLGVSSPRFLGSSSVPQYPAVQLPVAQPPIAQSSVSQEGSNNIIDEAGAIYYMQQLRDGNSNDQSQAHMSTTIPEQDDESSAYSHGSPIAYPSPKSGSRSPPLRQTTPMIFEPNSASAVSAMNLPTADRISPTLRSGLGRKPSGAREQATRSFIDGERVSSSPTTVTEEEEDPQSDDHSDNPMDQPQVLRSISSDDPNLDALAALSYLDTTIENPLTQANVEPLNVRSKAPSPPPAVPVIHEPEPQYKSSFAPSKQATERKAKVQAQQAAHHAATHMPGRVNGNKRKSRIAGAWNESSDDDDDEEEEEEEDDVDSDTDPSLADKPMPPAAPSNPQRSIQGHSQPGGSNIDTPQGFPHARPPRSLPQPPGNQNYRKSICIVTS